MHGARVIEQIHEEASNSRENPETIVSRRGAVVKRVEHISTIVLVNI